MRAVFLEEAWIFVYMLITGLASCDAFVGRSQTPAERLYRRCEYFQRHAVNNGSRGEFLESLDLPYDLNMNSHIRTQLLQNLIDHESAPGGSGLPKPGSVETFASVAPGTWRVVYAPHMTIAAGLLKGELRVQYDLRADGTMTSHARYSFPKLNLYGYLSVSGTYGSVNDDTCRVDFNEAWYRPSNDDLFREGPYPDIQSVPESLSKNTIRQVGKAFFIEPFAVFPVSYLDDELIVFDFELLGTRICARKEM